MIKAIALYNTPQDPQVFEEYFFSSHRPLAERVPGFLRAETARVTGSPGGPQSPFYRMAELWFADEGDFLEAWNSPEGQAVRADFEQFAGGVTILVTEVD